MWNSDVFKVDFVKGQDLWNDPYLVEIPAKTHDELRYLVVGKIAEQYWSGVITYRNEKIRIISMRRSRKEEVELDIIGGHHTYLFNIFHSAW